MLYAIKSNQIIMHKGYDKGYENVKKARSQAVTRERAIPQPGAAPELSWRIYFIT